jgi:glycosyltransferase involved in cell wall biosynthesis
MRVAVLNLAYPEAASGRDMLECIPTLTNSGSALARSGVEVIVLQRFTHDEDINLDGVQYRLRRDASSGTQVRPWTSIRTLLASARSQRPDVLHVNGLIFPSPVVQARAMLGRDVRIVVQHHGELTTPGKMRVLQRLCLRFAHAFIFNGAGNAAPWREAGIIRADQPVFEVVEGSCNFQVMQRDEAIRLTGMHGSPTVLWVGRLHLLKDPLTALEGFAASIAQLPEAQLYMIYGEDALLPEVSARLAQQPELARHVHLIGKVDHAALPAWYSAADLFLTSSPAEGSNYALIESMSCGAMPVCSDIPPHRYLTNDGAIGAMFDAGAATACADAIVRANTRLSAANRALVRQHFERSLSWDAIAIQLERAYGLLMSHAPD